MRPEVAGRKVDLPGEGEVDLCETRLRRCSDTSTILNFTVQTRRKPTMKEKKPFDDKITGSSG